MYYALTFLLLSACDNPYKEAKEKNTIEAYELFLKENPKHAQKVIAEYELEKLYKDKADASQSLKDYDVYLQRFEKKKDSSEYQKVVQQRLNLAWKMTNAEDTPEAYQKFIDKYSSTNDPKVATAKIQLKTAEYKSKIQVSDLEQEQANTAENPDGPLNGWQFKAKITNNTTRDIKFLKAKVHFLDAEGKILSSHVNDDTIMIGELYGRAWATPKARKPPFKIGESREWIYLTGDTPPGWSKKIKIQLFQVHFMND